MNVLILNKSFIQSRVNVMRLVRVHRPSMLEIILLFFHFGPSVLLDHELPRHLVPPLFPVNSGVQNQDRHIVNPSVHSYQPKPTALHRPELVIIHDQSIVVQLVFIDRALVVKLDRVLWSEFINRDYGLFCFLYLNLPRNVAFEWSDKEAI